MRALKFTMKWEGWFSNDSVDPGGKTKYGISDAGDGTVDGLIDIDRDGVGDVKVEDLTKAQAIEIYYKSYWLASGCDKLDPIDAIVMFDTAVNCGVGRAKRWWKQCSQDRKRFLNLRVVHYMSIIQNNPALGKFKRGWMNRVNDLKKYVDILAKEVVPELTYVTKLESEDSNKTKT